MYAGHFATALFLHRTTSAQKHTVWIPMVGVGLLDLVNSILTGLGIERVTPNLNEPIGFELTAIDWDHSFAMALLWALLFALPWWRDIRRAALAATAVFSHFLLDLLVHDHDMALWPGSTVRLGFEGWKQCPWGAWGCELLFSAACVAWLCLPRRKGGETLPVARMVSVSLMMLSLNLTFSPAWSPLREAAARLPGPQACVAYSVLVGVGFIIPTVVLGRLMAGVQLQLTS
jgi:hypothetical protein